MVSGALNSPGPDNDSGPKKPFWSQRTIKTGVLNSKGSLFATLAFYICFALAQGSGTTLLFSVLLAAMGSKYEGRRTAEVVAELKESFASGKTRIFQWRAAQLKAVVRMIDEKEDDIAAAIYEDLAKPRTESCLQEVLQTFFLSLINAVSLFVYPLGLTNIDYDHKTWFWTF